MEPNDKLSDSNKFKRRGEVVAWLVHCHIKRIIPFQQEGLQHTPQKSFKNISDNVDTTFKIMGKARYEGTLKTSEKANIILRQPSNSF